MSNGYENDRYSPSLQGDIESWKKIIELGRENSPEEVLKLALEGLSTNREEYNWREDGTDYILSSESERIKTKEGLIEETDVDEDEYDIYWYSTNKWDQHSVQKGLVELFQVKLKMKRLYPKLPDPDWLDQWLDEFDRELSNIRPTQPEPKEGKPIVLALADLHTGGFSEGDVLVPDYNSDMVAERLEYIAEVVNSYDRPVHIKILGDLIESFTGKNHKNTWKQIEEHGMEAALVAFDIIREFLLSIDNLSTVNFIGGNHDRISKHWSEDKQGQVSYLVEGLMSRWINNLDSQFSPILLSDKHDDIQYIISHGDKKISKSDSSELVLKYGDQDLYNVLLYAHGHEEKVIKSTRKLRVQQIPPVCPPNQYAVQNGYDGASGFVIIERGDFGGVDILTKSL